MEIVHLIFSFHTGGAEAMLVDILHYQSKRYSTHLVIVNDETNHELLTSLPPATRVHLIGRKAGSRSLFPLLRLNFLLRQIDTAVLHMHNVDAIALFPKWFEGTWRKVITIHGLNKSCRNLTRYNTIFAISNAVKKDLGSRCGCDSIVIPNGINFDAINRKRKVKSREDPCKIVQISRLIHGKKGQHLLLDALAVLRRIHQVNATVTFIGEGPSLAMLQLKAQEIGVEKYCSFVGLWTRKRIYQELYTFDILVQPSIYEGFGLTVLEGIAAGLPIVASDDGGPAEILKSGKYGWLFTNGDSKDLADKLRTVIELIQFGSVRTKLQSAYNYSKENFDISDTADKYLSEY